MRLFKLTVVGAMLAVAAFAQPVAAAPAGTVECGIFQYVPADAVNQGSIEFGGNTSLGLTGKLYVIAAGATAPANLSDLGGGAPTCLRLTLDAGLVTHMEYVPKGSITGKVVVYGDPVNDPENAFYITAGRVFTPAQAVDAYPGLQAILGNAEVTGSNVTIVFQIDTDFGYPVGFKATTHLRGLVTLSPGDIGVGLGTLPEEVIDATSRTTLEQASGLGENAVADITSMGTIAVNTGDLTVATTLDVSLANDPVAGSVVGPCGAQAYYGVFDNSGGTKAVTFRLKWTTSSHSEISTTVVPAGQTYRTWQHWTKAGKWVRVSYWNKHLGQWIALQSERAVRGSFPACSYVPGFEPV